MFLESKFTAQITVKQKRQQQPPFFAFLVIEKSTIFCPNTALPSDHKEGICGALFRQFFVCFLLHEA